MPTIRYRESYKMFSLCGWAKIVWPHSSYYVHFIFKKEYRKNKGLSALAILSGIIAIFSQPSAVQIPKLSSKESSFMRISPMRNHRATNRLWTGTPALRWIERQVKQHYQSRITGKYAFYTLSISSRSPMIVNCNVWEWPMLTQTVKMCCTLFGRGRSISIQEYANENETRK